VQSSPGTRIDRRTFSEVAIAMNCPYVSISGNGNRESNRKTAIGQKSVGSNLRHKSAKQHRRTTYFVNPRRYGRKESGRRTIEFHSREDTTKLEALRSGRIALNKIFGLKDSNSFDRRGVVHLIKKSVHRRKSLELREQNRRDGLFGRFQMEHCLFCSDIS
jgi:hypothetical protein